MRKLVGILGSYYREEFRWSSLLLSMLLAAVLTYFAYRNDFYEVHIESAMPLDTQIYRYCLLYALAFGGTFLLQGMAERDLRFLRSANWWLLMSMAIALFAFRGSDFDFRPYLFGAESNGRYTLQSKLAYNLGGFATLMVPCFVYWFFVDRGRQNYYGFKWKGVSFSPYFIMLAMMLPLLFWAGTQADFLSTYPRYTKIGVEPEAADYVRSVFLYELAYGSDFLVTEFFFRGFVVLAFAARFGHKAILPMCVYYVTIHYGKPLGETISSFFGGFLLGIIAYRTQSIFGGVIVHLGIAYLMEVFAFLGHSGYLHLPF